MYFDQILFEATHNLAGKSRLLDFFGIFLADYLGYFLAVFALATVWSLGNWKKRIHYFSFLALATILSRGIFTELIRFLYLRPRPFVVLNFEPLIDKMNEGAFPSGHAAFYFALAGVVFLINRKWGQYLAGGAAVMGLARVFVGVHWPLDIFGGALIAAMSVYIIYLLFKSSQ